VSSDEFDKVELPALNQLQSLGWAYLEGSRLSLNELDAEVKQSEEVMRGYLRELGYE